MANYIDLGYIHPTEKRWHHKRFVSEACAFDAKRALEKARIPFLEYQSATGAKINHGASMDTILNMFIEMGGEWDIEDRVDMLPYVIYTLITDGLGDKETFTIGGHRYHIESDSFRQDEMWAETYNSYSGYDKVGIVNITDMDNDDVEVSFYWAL